jgi:hypothetical protein
MEDYMGIIDYGPGSVPTLGYRDKKSPHKLQFELCIDTEVGS